MSSMQLWKGYFTTISLRLWVRQFHTAPINPTQFLSNTQVFSKRTSLLHVCWIFVPVAVSGPKLQEGGHWRRWWGYWGRWGLPRNPLPSVVWGAFGQRSICVCPRRWVGHGGAVVIGWGQNGGDSGGRGKEGSKAERRRHAGREETIRVWNSFLFLGEQVSPLFMKAYVALYVPE